MNAIIGLANNNIGQAIMSPLVRSGEILRLSEETVRPFYEKKSARALEWTAEAFDDALPWRVHGSEGALFHWHWFQDLPLPASELYQRLKKRGVLVVPGHYFFYGLPPEDDHWRHREECIRVTFTMDEAIVRDGLKVIGEEVARAYAGS